MPLLINGVLLVIFGLLAVYSVSIYESFSLSIKLGRDPTNYFYFWKQVSSLLYIVVGIFLVWKFPTRIFKSHKFALFALVVAFILQICVFIPGIGVELNGARGWIFFPGLPSIQPSEIFKLAYVFFLASWLIRKKEHMQSFEFLIQFIVINALLWFIFLLIPDFGTVLIL